MNLSEEAPKLPKFPFIAGDLVLIAGAVFIANRSDAPMGSGPLLAITICLVAGAALAVIPFLADYARRQDAELTERQNQIAALARTTSESAEQLGIVASGLNGIAESSKHNLETLAQLPTKLKERIDSLSQQLASSATAAHSSVKADAAQLEAASEKISHALAKLEAATKTKSDTLAAIEKDLAAALARAATQIDAFVATATTAAERLAELPPPAPVVTPPAKPSRPKREPAPIPAEPEAVVPPPAPEPAPIEPAAVAPEPIVAAIVEPAPVAAPEPPAEPAPVEIQAEPAVEPETFAASEPDASEVPVSDPEPPKPPRARKPKPADDGFDLGLAPDVAETAESAITSDGFTRLIATAYIGIGNKLFVRGDGPGLSWEKGIPLQFVSIGKWRWETPDATAPISVKLYKNDQVECVGLGTLTLEPGRQHEVNAGF
ncbi:MAG: hypothetical protein WC205_00750 [Opitutaceae bacterium]|jgi:cytochrome c556